jgi:hypothetical protein
LGEGGIESVWGRGENGGEVKGRAEEEEIEGQMGVRGGRCRDQRKVKRIMNRRPSLSNEMWDRTVVSDWIHIPMKSHRHHMKKGARIYPVLPLLSLTCI